MIAEPAGAWTSDQTDREVRALLGRFFGAVERHDLPTFLALFSGGADFTVVENAEWYDWPEFQRFATGFFTEVTAIRFDLERCAVDALAPHVAVATGVFQGKGSLVSGEALAFRTAFTFVLVKEGDQWRIQHAHESALESPASEPGADDSTLGP